ncbi:MAG: tRNA (adenosine(37)-N6)-threonylcarbamoyltransferase complex dimerization subunit type 1 TsaB [Blastocatellia bacterium]|nr:tRNA (adenosine(37)-N6)-threonylcarbamoyltransferase complex dimerization subunit type 1 TsaB [Blastocatellia bacterium]
MSKESTDYSILAVDTSSPLASLAIVRGELTLAALAGNAHLPHSQTFFSNLPILLQLAGLEMRQIDAFAAATGPGSFTGLRVGLAAVKGLAHTLDRPAIGVCSFDALALGSGASGPVLVMLDAGREEAYCGLREATGDGNVKGIGQDRVGKPAFVLPDLLAGVKSLVATGSAAVKFKKEIDIAAGGVGVDQVEVRQPWQLTASIVALVAARRLVAGIKPELHPYYVRKSDAEIKLMGLK